MPSIEFKFDRGQIDELSDVLRDTQRGLPDGLCDAVNETLAAELKLIVKSLCERANVKPAELAPLLKVVPAQPGQSPQGGIDVSNKRLTLRSFGPQSATGGVAYQIYRSRATQTIPRAFIGTRVSGEVLKRVGSRFVKLYGPSPNRMLTATGLLEPTLQHIEKSLSAAAEMKVRRIFSELKTK